MPRCADCGFLAVRDPQNQQLVEVSILGRESWELPARTVATGSSTFRLVDRVPIFEQIPICAVGAHPIDREAIDEKPAYVLPVLQKERECPAFYTWKRCFSPKEHQEMWMVEETRRLAAEEAEKNRLWQHREHMVNRVTQVMCVFFTVLMSIVGIYIAKQVNQPAPIVIQVPPPAK